MRLQNARRFGGAICGLTAVRDALLVRLISQRAGRGEIRVGTASFGGVEGLRGVEQQNGNGLENAKVGNWSTHLRGSTRRLGEQRLDSRTPHDPATAILVPPTSLLRQFSTPRSLRSRRIDLSSPLRVLSAMCSY